MRRLLRSEVPRKDLSGRPHAASRPSTARSVRSSSQSISNSAKVRVFGFPQYEAGDRSIDQRRGAEDVEQLGAMSGTEGGVQALPVESRI
jgi:hypothetical protein